jgi:hypothetical protein
VADEGTPEDHRGSSIEAAQRLSPNPVTLTLRHMKAHRGKDGRQGNARPAVIPRAGRSIR